MKMEKTLTFTVEDALLSPIGFAILSGAGLLKGKDDSEEVHVHATSQTYCSNGAIDLKDVLDGTEIVCATAPVFVLEAEKDGSITGNVLSVTNISGTTLTGVKKGQENFTGNVFVDFYVVKKANTVSELQIDAENFAGYYYVEASTLFRRQNDGVDLPAEITFPNVKIQSNFTFSMASTGDPSTFTFTMDAMPGYTVFEPNKKVLCAIQIVDDQITKTGGTAKSVFPHANEHADLSAEDSYNA